LEIPFGGGDPLHDKAVHQHLLDVLHQLDTKQNPKYYTSSESIDELWDENYESAKQQFLDSINYDYPYPVVDKFLKLFPLSRFPEFYDSKWHKEYEKDADEFERQVGYDINKFITDEGESALKTALDGYFNDALDEYDAKWKMKKTQDENGLIPIYRAIQFSKSEDKDEFENAIRHGGVGYYWSWDLDGAQPYGGYGGETLILYGKIKPEYVNWQSTIYKNAWDLSYEREVEINACDVLIYAIGKSRRQPKTIQINPPIIVPA
jgi:hypothetical protein